MPGNGPAIGNALMPRPTSSAAPTVAAQAAEQKAAAELAELKEQLEPSFSSCASEPRHVSVED